MALGIGEVRNSKVVVILEVVVDWEVELFLYLSLYPTDPLVDRGYQKSCLETAL